MGRGGRRRFVTLLDWGGRQDTEQVILPGVSVDDGNGEVMFTEGIKKAGVPEDGGADGSEGNDTEVGAVRDGIDESVTERKSYSS